MAAGITSKALRGYIAAFAVIIAEAGILALAVPPAEAGKDWSVVMYDGDGGLLGAKTARDGQWRFPPDPTVPAKYAAAVIAYEDGRFLSHPGIDPAGIVRAAISNVASGGIVSGGSTITMQVIRLMGSNPERTWAEKAREACLALRLDLFSAKKDILALYAAHAPFGGNVVGLRAAAFRYTGRPPESLSWAEACMLAVLPNNPGLVHPGKNRGTLRLKRDRLLEKLRASGVITSQELFLAKEEPIPPAPFPLPRLAPHLFEFALRDAKESDNSAIHTSLSGRLQERIASVMERTTDRLERSGVMNGSCLVVDVDTARILAWIGNSGTGGSDSGRDVDIVTSSRSSGSLLKPFLYAAALDSGELLPRQLLVDIPTRIGSYSPENNVPAYSGVIPADRALARSLNVPFVRLLKSYGLERFARMLADCGMTTLFRSADEYGLPLILGGAETTLLEITGMYASLARTAKYPKDQSAFRAPTWKADNADTVRGRMPLTPGAAWLTLEALLSVSRPAEEAAWQDFASSKKIAWKTGTSFGYRDAWAIGVTSKYAVGVWIGNADGTGRPGLKGISAAAPALFEIFSGLENAPWFAEPRNDLKPMTTCAVSGYLAGPDCEETREEAVPSGALNFSVCPYCRTVHLDMTGTRQVGAEVTVPSAMRTEKRFVLPPAYEYWYARENLSYRPLPPFEADETGFSGRGALNILFPEEDSAIYIPIELDGRPGKTVFQAVHRDRNATLFWHLDNAFLQVTKGIHKMEMRPPEGKHTLMILDERGEPATRRFEVLSSK